MRCFLFAVSLVLFSPAGLSQAQTAKCSDPQTTVEMKMCAHAAYKAADQDLNADYKVAKKFMRTLDQDLPIELKGAEKSLLKAQRIWIKFRDAQCRLEGFAARGGTMEGLLITSCLERMTRSRSEVLRILFEQN